MKNKQIYITLLVGLGFFHPTTFSQKFPTTFPWITDTVYIAGSATDGGDGSIRSPYNSWDDFSFKSKTAYLFKRGESMEIPGTIAIKADSVFFGGYSQGERPLLKGMGNSRHLYFMGTQQYIQGINIACKDTGTCISFLGDSTKFAWADSMELSHAWWGVSPAKYGKIILSNLYVHRMRTDGIYASYNDTVIILNTHVNDVNRWYEYIQDINTSGGDCVQFVSNDYIVIDGCELDHSDNPGKFALIATGADTVNVFNSKLIGYDSTAVVYAGGANRGMHFENCKFIGSKYGIWNFVNLVVKNCVFKSQWINCIRGPKGTICNSVFADNPGGREYKVQKYNSATGEYYYVTQTSRGIALPFSGTPQALIYNNIFYNVNQSMECFTKYIDSTVMVYNNNYYNDPSKFKDQPINQAGKNIFTVDPKFDTSKGDSTDFYLQNSSELIDAGFDLSSIGIELICDINGRARPNGNGYDIGAYEYYNYEVNKEPIENKPSNVIKIFPNPTMSDLNVNSLKGPIQDLEIYSITGEKIYKSGYLNTDNYSLSILGLSSGVYIVRVSILGEEHSIKIMKE